jgi:hypothetical protein
MCKNYSYLYTGLDRPLRLQEFDPRISRQLGNEGDKVVSPVHRPPLPPGGTSDTHFCHSVSRPQGHSAAGKIKSMKDSNDPNGNQTRDFSGCSPAIN